MGKAYRELAAPVLIVRPLGPLAERAKDMMAPALFRGTRGGKKSKKGETFEFGTRC